MYQNGRAQSRVKLSQFEAELEANPGGGAELARKRIKSYEIPIATPESIREIREALELD